MKSVKDALSLLGLTPGASWDEVNGAYRDLVRVWHPDRFQGDARLIKKANEQTVLLNSAIQKLRDEYQPEQPQPRPASKPSRQQNRDSEPRKTHPSRPMHNPEHDASTHSDKTQGFLLPALLVKHKKVTAMWRIIASFFAGYLGYWCLTQPFSSAAETGFGCALSLLALDGFVKGSCLLVIRRPLVRIDSHGITTWNLGLLAWGEVTRVWALSAAKTPLLAIECAPTYVASQPWHRKASMRTRRFFNKAHFLVICSGLNAHPNDIVRAINAQHLTGNISLASPANKDDKNSLYWSRLIGSLAAVAVILRCILGHNLSVIDLAFYFSVFAACQAYTFSTQLLRVPSQA
jgi:hypothetical protein